MNRVCYSLLVKKDQKYNAVPLGYFIGLPGLNVLGNRLPRYLAAHSLVRGDSEVLEAAYAVA